MKPPFLVAALVLAGCAAAPTSGRPPAAGPSSGCELANRTLARIRGLDLSGWQKGGACGVKGSSRDLKADVDPYTELRSAYEAQGWKAQRDTQADGHCSGSVRMRRAGVQCELAFACSATDDESTAGEPLAYEAEAQCRPAP